MDEPAATPFSFRVLSTDGHARRGVVSTPHGDFDTPAFMPVGTQATVKGLTPRDLAETATQVVLANAYHLMLRPGVEVVSALGGLYAFMGWDGPILSDSGGYQVFSLAELRRVDDDGVEFRSHLDGTPLRLTPELSVEVQNRLGADIIMAFDECPALPAPRHLLTEAVRRTVSWARRCRAAHRRPEQALYGIVQGGLDLELRRECLEQLLEIGFDGYAIGGLSVGEPPAEMWAFLAEFAWRLPADRPRYLMGVGRPVDLVSAVAAGLDLFDCVLPTRNGRKGYAFTSAGPLRLRNACHQLSTEPLDPACDCYTCRSVTRGYLRHLFLAEESLGGVLVCLHNIAYFQRLMREMRDALAAGTFEAWRRWFLQSSAAEVNREHES